MGLRSAAKLRVIAPKCVSRTGSLDRCSKSDYARTMLPLLAPLFRDAISALLSIGFPCTSLSRLTVLLTVVGVAEMFGAIAFLVLGIIAPETDCGVTDEYVD